MGWPEELIHVVIDRTIEPLWARRNRKSHGLAGWVIDDEAASPSKELEAEMKERYDSLVKGLSEAGLEWRTDSRLLKKHLRTGKPPIDQLVEMLITMKFLHEKTPYKFIKGSIYPPSSRVQYEPVTRMESMKYYFSHGGGRENVPEHLLAFWDKNCTN